MILKYSARTCPCLLLSFSVGFFLEWGVAACVLVLRQRYCIINYNVYLPSTLIIDS
jgi:hypothetical protein